MNPTDLTEATGAESVMVFHLHDLCDSWHVSEDEDEEGAEEKELLRMEIYACDASFKLFELTIEWVEE